MAVITNMATLTYNGGVVNSNVTRGELLTTLTVSKTADAASYTPDERIAYIITLVNTGTTPLTDLTVTDDLGTFEVEGVSYTPLTYIDGTLRYFVNGTPETAPTVEAGPPLVISGVTVPAGGNVALVYTAVANGCAPRALGSTITNEATAVGTGLACPVSASATVPVLAQPLLSITKTMNPTTITENGLVTYTFTVLNSGNEAAVATDNIVISDVFDPRLANIAVTLNGAPLTEGTDYTYDEASGAFSTTAGIITVPAATIGEDAPICEQGITPGTAILTVTGSVLGCANLLP